tara:strand:- start:22257 stop:22718 length:462 start_codon:yes stop_codon:yes gene_type:complete
MGKSLKILLFMYILTRLSFAQDIINPGIYCHRGGNGKFTLNLNTQVLGVNSLYSERERRKMFDSEKESDHNMLGLEGSYLQFIPTETTNGYLNVKAHDPRTKTLINMNIKDIEQLISGERSKVNGDVTIFSFDIDPNSMFQEYRTSVRCELEN